MRRWLIVSAALGTVLAVLASAGGVGFWTLYLKSLARGDAQLRPADYRPRAMLRGGDGGGLPRASAMEEGIEPEALRAADEASAQAGADALLVMRRGHLVHERYLRGDANGLVDGFAPLLRSLAAAAAIQDGKLTLQSARQRYGSQRLVAGWRNPWSQAAQQRFGPALEALRGETGMPYAQYVSDRIWAPLNAAAAQLWRPGEQVRSDCCVLARPVDWLRLAQLVLDGGQLGGETVLSPQWLQVEQQHMQQLAARAPGPEPLVTPAVWLVQGAGGSRLWLVPRLQLAILSIAPRVRPAPDDTTLANLILRGMPQRVQAGQRADQPDIRSLVPAH